MATKKSKSGKSARSVASIEKYEAEGGLLNAAQCKILLRKELSRVVRTLADCKCFLTGAHCPPGIIVRGLGQAAHLIPIDDLPPQYKYDPYLCIWLETMEHLAFDGKLGMGRKAANQAAVWGKLQREDPDRFEFVTSLPKNRGQFKERVADLREQLRILRAQ